MVWPTLESRTAKEPNRTGLCDVYMSVRTRLSIERPESAALDGRVADERDAQPRGGRVKHPGRAVAAQPAHQPTGAARRRVVGRAAALAQLDVVERAVGRALHAEVDELERRQPSCHEPVT